MLVVNLVVKEVTGGIINKTHSDLKFGMRISKHQTRNNLYSAKVKVCSRLLDMDLELFGLGHGFGSALVSFYQILLLL